MTTSAIALNMINDAIVKLKSKGFKLVRNTFDVFDRRCCAVTAVSLTRVDRKSHETILGHASRILGISNDQIWAFTYGFDGTLAMKKRYIKRSDDLLAWYEAGAECARRWNVA